MKKAFIFLVTGLATLTASAQADVVKEAERAMKGGKSYTEVLQIITPAFTNAETSNLAQTYYIPGKAGFKQYDDLLGHKQLGMTKEGDELKMAVALLGGFDNFTKALPLDTITDAKGKLKTKYSKEIKSTIAGHYIDFLNAGHYFNNAEDYKNTYRCWDVFCKLTKDADRFGIKACEDSILTKYMMNRSIVAYLAHDYPVAIQSFRETLGQGTPTSEVIDFAVTTATEGKDNDALLEFATLGNKLYGKSKPQYIGQIINYYLQTEKYDDAIKYLDAAIAEDASNAQYYALEGIIYDNKKENDKAMELYGKSITIDPENELGNFYYGRGLAAKASILSDAYDGDPYKFNAYKVAKVDPVYRDAVNYLEKAYSITKDPEMRKNALDTLNIVYYQLNDEAGLESVKQRKLDD